MDSSNLPPPSIYGLSDSVIGNLTHPTWEPRATPDNRTKHQERTSQLQPYEQDSGLTSRDRRGTASVFPGSANAQHAYQASAATSRMRLRSGRLPYDPRRKSTSSWNKALLSIAILQANGVELSEQQQRSIMEDVLRKASRHRHLQASYERKGKETIERLEHDVQQLRCAITKLQRQLGSIQLCTLNLGALARTYQQHFRAFVADPVRQKASASGFLLCILVPEVVSDPFYGVEAVLKNWRMVSTHFDDVDLEFNDLKRVTPDILVGTTTTRVTISDNTLRSAFPHLNSDGWGGLRGGEWSPAAIKLLDKSLVMRGSVRFHLNNTGNRVVWIERETDMLPPMMRILGSVESVHQVLNQALLAPEFRAEAHSA